jgi:hypothetical protein
MPVDLDIAGVRTLTLRVTEGDDGASHDHADWTDARIIMKDGSPPPLTLPPFESIKLATKNFLLEFEVGDDGRLYQRAVGTRAEKERISG